ncbi:MAG: radical SAM protein [Pseudomonadota bacterium]
MPLSESQSLKERILAAERDGGLRALLVARIGATDGAWAVVADLTDGCRQGCLTCPAKAPTDDHLRAWTAEALGEVMLPRAEFLAIGCLGEPLLHPDVAGILAALGGIKARTRSDAFICLLTAATVRAGGQLVDLARTGLDILLVSVDATDVDAYARVRGGARWEETRTRLGEALPAFARAGVRLGAQVMLLRCTAGHARRTFEDLAGLGFSSVTFTQPTQVPARAEGEVLRTDAPEFSGVQELERWLAPGNGAPDIRSALPRRAPDLGGGLRALFGDGATWDEDRAPGAGICVAPWFNLRVDCRGRVFPCNFMDDPGDAIGDVEDGDFEAIAGGARSRRIRRALLDGRCPTRACERCAFGPGARP